MYSGDEFEFTCSDVLQMSENSMKRMWLYQVILIYIFWFEFVYDHNSHTHTHMIMIGSSNNHEVTFENHIMWWFQSERYEVETGTKVWFINWIFFVKSMGYKYKTPTT